MLAKLQQQLNDTYQTDPGYDVRDFLITDQRLAKVISGENKLTNSGETLLIYQDDEGLSLSLYLEQEILSRLESMGPQRVLRAGRLDDLCKVIEGLSHFNYVVWCATRDRSVSLLELELQAEVDKFVSTMQLAIDHGDNEMLNGLHGRIFENARFNCDLDDDQLERYRAATEYAARFCRGLRSQLIRNGDDVLPELRRFYRLPLRDKISHIHTRAWAAS
jgi:hypothetical protein